MAISRTNKKSAKNINTATQIRYIAQQNNEMENPLENQDKKEKLLFTDFVSV